MQKKQIETKPVKHIQKKVSKQIAPKPVREERASHIRLYLSVYVCIATIVFGVLAFFAHLFPYFPVDLIVTRSIQQITIPWFSPLMQYISYFGYYPQSIFTVGIICIFLLLIGLRLEAIVGVINALSITLVGLLIKSVIGRPRPDISLVHVMKHLSENSFPSGHVLFYTSFFGFLCFLAFTLLKYSHMRNVIVSILFIIIVLVGPSRIYLGEHWASDVSGAYLFGSIWLIITIHFYDWAKKRFFVRQPVAPEKK